MIYRRLNYSLTILIIAIFLTTAFLASAAQEVTLTAKYKGGDRDGQTVTGGIEPASTIELEAYFDGEPNICEGALNYKLFHTISHAIGGNPNNLEYIGRGEGDINFSYVFNSNQYGQKNTYQAIFYCWSSDNPQIALSTAQQWKSPVFNQDTLGGVCSFSNLQWSDSSPTEGEMVEMSVKGSSLGCKGLGFKFEIWSGTNGCKGLANRVAATVDASFSAEGSVPFASTGKWKVPDDKQYCFKIRLGPNKCASSSNGTCLWSGPLKAGVGGDDNADDGRTTSASLEFPNPLNAKDLRELIDALLRWIWLLSIPIAVIMILYAGLKMMTAGGDPKRFQSGRKILLRAVVGLAVVFIGEGFIALIKSILDLGK